MKSLLKLLSCFYRVIAACSAILLILSKDGLVQDDLGLSVALFFLVGGVAYVVLAFKGRGSGGGVQR